MPKFNYQQTVKSLKPGCDKDINRVNFELVFLSMQSCKLYLLLRGRLYESFQPGLYALVTKIPTCRR